MIRRLLPLFVPITLLLGLAAPAHADDPPPPYVGWSQLLPSLVDDYEPNSANPCVSGKPSCVKITINEMQRRFAPLASGCDHRAVFSLAYLRTTQTYAQVAAEAGFFQDAPFVNHEDAVFAKYYFAAYDDYVAGRLDRVPQAWRIAWDAATSRTVSGSGDLMLGMNAHVNRDLPYVLAAIGLVTPDGSSRKPDHDKVNEFLNQVVQPLIDEEAARFDPAMDDANTPGGISYTALMQLLVSWRETAWRNAERLVSASDAASRQQVADSIEAYAADNAAEIVAQYAYVPPVSSTAPRDAYCAVHHG